MYGLRFYVFPLSIGIPLALSMWLVELGSHYLHHIEANSRLRFARVFVEVDIDAQFPEEIEVDMGNGHSFVVGIEYPWIPVKCTKCSVFGY